MTSVLAAGITLAALGLAASSSPGAPARVPRRAAAALPDSVLARLPHRDLTAREFTVAWNRLEPRFRPRGQGLAQKRAFLDQLLEREVIARAAVAEPFVMTDVESAQFLATRDKAIDRTLFQRLVADSAVVLQSDRDSAKVRLTASAQGKQEVPAEALEKFAHTVAEGRRSEEIDARIKAALEPAWDDTAAARLARGYAGLDPRKPDMSRPFSLHLNERIPALAPADTGLVLVRSTAGSMSAGEFTRRFALLNPFEADFPTTPGTVKARGEQFLGQRWFRQEAERQDIAHDPAVLEAVRNHREGLALDHYFARHVQAKIDTSDAVLKPFFAQNAQRYAVPGHSLVVNLVTPSQATADSLVQELNAGAPWDSICAHHVPEGPTRQQCGGTSNLPDAFPDSALVKRVVKLAPGQIISQPLAPPNQGVVVLKMVERVPFRLRTFEEARTFVVRDASSEQAERLLQAELVRLKRGMPVTRNERALARVDLGVEPAFRVPANAPTR